MAEGGDTVSVLSDEDVVADLLSVPFSRRQFNEKMDIVKKGRPTPERLEITKVTKAGYERHFQASNWERYPWLTGSVRHKKLYCWACLLFGTDKGAWNWKGYDNLDSFTKSALKHEGSASHLKSTITLKTFGDSRIDLQLDEQRRRDISMHNEKVKKNRELLKRLINAVVFLGKQELSFRGHDESKTSLNRGNYVELLSYSAEHDPDLHYHLTTNKVFIGTSSQIQNDLISAVADVLNDAIKEEINKTPFVSLMMDETSDVSNAAQLSLVLRYVTDSGIKERFIKMVDVSGNKRAADLATLAFEFLEEYGCTDKLIAQCYDGAPVMASGLNGVQAKVKEKKSLTRFSYIVMPMSLIWFYLKVLLKLKNAKYSSHTFLPWQPFSLNHQKEHNCLMRCARSDCHELHQPDGTLHQDWFALYLKRKTLLKMCLSI